METVIVPAAAFARNRTTCRIDESLRLQPATTKILEKIESRKRRGIWTKMIHFLVYLCWHEINIRYRLSRKTKMVPSHFWETVRNLLTPLLKNYIFWRYKIFLILKIREVRDAPCSQLVSIHGCNLITELLLNSLGSSYFFTEIA